jgi:Ca2+-binding EF-hand superfamily protein
MDAKGSIYERHGVRAYHTASQRSLGSSGSRRNLNFPPFASEVRALEQSRSSKQLLPSDETMEELTAWAASNGGAAAARAARPLTPTSLAPPKAKAPTPEPKPKPTRQQYGRKAVQAPTSHETLRKQFEEQLERKHKDLRRAFQSIDVDRSGKMSHEEILTSMLSLQLKCDERDVDTLIKECDTNGDGEIDFQEFKAGIMKLSQTHGGDWHPGDNQPKKAMIHKHALGAETGVEATEAELERYMGSLRQAVEAKYSLLRKAFRSMDADASNHLSKEEIIDAVQHFALPIPVSHIGEVFDKILDIDGDGKVSYVEFCEKLKPYEISNM